MPRKTTTNLARSLIALASILLAGAAHSQTAAPSETYPAILITHTAVEATTLLHQLQTGFDFAVLAKEHSLDPSADDGGSLTPSNVAALSPALQNALHKLHPGEFTPPLPVASGFAILTLLRAPPRPDLNRQQIQSLAAAAHIRESINVDGMSEEDTVFENFDKPSDWKQNLARPCEIRKLSHPQAIQRMQALLASGQNQSGQPAAPIDQLRTHVVLAQLQAFVGDMNASIAEWTSAYKIAQTSAPSAIPYLQEALGSSYLHRSELENGVYRDNGTLDIFPPLDPSAHFAKTADSEQAIQYFTAFLDKAPHDLQVRWLLNLAYVTLGQYPAQVPLKYLITPGVFRSTQNIGRFTDVAVPSGLNVFSAAGGVVVDDFDNDGLLDVITSSADMCDPLHFFHNNGDGTFSDRTAQAGLSNQLGGLNLIQADYNNDGCMDLLVLRAGWEFPIRNSLLRNNCNGTFTDVTTASGLDKSLGPTQTAAWADIDNDGNLDLFIGNENAPSQLFHNRGDGTFEDISHSAGIDKIAFTKGVVAADYDRDGYVDFYLSNFDGANVLYRNNHNLTFTDVARQAGVQSPFVSFATWFFDYDNDGWPDLFVTSYNNYTDDQVLHSYLGLPISVETEKLYRNRHDGTFEDVTTRVGLDKVFMPMGANFGDVDNDGYLDIYLGMGSPSFASLMPHVLLHNNAGRSFADITASSGTGELHKGHGIAFADLDHTGRIDIVALTGGAVPSDKHTMRVFQAPPNSNDWINLRLIGVKSNRSAIGAEIQLTVTDATNPQRSIYRTVGDTSSFGGNPMEQHIGLGPSAHNLSIDIFWPASNTRQHFNHVTINQFLSIKEFDTTYTPLNRKPFQLGARTVATAPATHP